MADGSSFGQWLEQGRGSAIKKMMLKMGYKWGHGLGKNEDGIIEPVRGEVQLREGRKGLGAEVESSQKS